MPFSILLHGYPKTDIPVSHVQGSALQGMFLHLMQEVDPAVSARLHNDDKYRPYTLSPLGVGETTPNLVHEGKTHPYPSQEGKFQGFRLPRENMLRHGTPCYLRMTLLDDALFLTFSRYFLDRAEPTVILGETEFVVTGVLNETHPLPGGDMPWTQYVSYADLINRASRSNRQLALRFLTPTSFQRGNVDFPLPDPRLVFRSYVKRFAEFDPFPFLSDFEEQVEFYTGIANLKHLETRIIKTKKVSLLGFTGRVTYELDHNAPSDLIFQMNLLAAYAFFCGTGRKTTMGMGQTVFVT
jgi:CRISPR-associated endoribonuclease Cas6